MSNWDDNISSVPLSFAKEFSKTNRVFYFDNPLTIKDIIFNFFNKKITYRLLSFFINKYRYNYRDDLGPSLYIVVPSPTLPINFLPQGKIYNSLRRLNLYLVRRSLDNLMKSFAIEDYIFFNSFNPFYHHPIIPKNRPPQLLVYQSQDDMSQVTYAAKHGTRLEIEAIKSSDICFATSKHLARKLELLTSRKVLCLHNAVDTSSFPHSSDVQDKPDDIASINKEIICFIGNLDQRIDYNLLYEIATSYPDRILLLIGPRNDSNYHSIGFDSLSNVIFLGPKPHKQLHRYLRAASCAIIPFLKNTLTASIYPLKINEYLAMGKPVVTTDFSEDILTFEPVAYIANDRKSFTQLISKAIDEATDTILAEKRVKYAHNNTWKARVDEFWNVANQHLSTR